MTERRIMPCDRFEDYFFSDAGYAKFGTFGNNFFIHPDGKAKLLFEEVEVYYDMGDTGTYILQYLPDASHRSFGSARIYFNDINFNFQIVGFHNGA